MTTWNKKGILKEIRLFLFVHGLNDVDPAYLVLQEALRGIKMGALSLFRGLCSGSNGN